MVPLSSGTLLEAILYVSGFCLVSSVRFWGWFGGRPFHCDQVLHRG